MICVSHHPACCYLKMIGITMDWRKEKQRKDRQTVVLAEARYGLQFLNIAVK